MTVLNTHHRWMTRVLAATVATDQLLGLAYGFADHCGTWNGLYLAIETVTTVGYGDLVPHGWLAHLVAVAIMVLAIPLWTGAFSLLTTGFITSHVDTRHDELRERLHG